MKTIKGYINKKETKVLVTEQLKSDLIDFAEDHVEHFQCLPTEFEYEGVVVDFNDFIDLIPESITDKIEV